MASKCFMCGTAIARGILCEKCDKPRGKTKLAEPVKTSPPASAQAPASSPMPAQTSAPASLSGASSSGGSSSGASASGASALAFEASVPELDPFPKAPILPFPIESASPAVTSVANVLIAAGVPGIVLGPDRSVKFVTEEARKLFHMASAELSNVKQIEAAASVRIGDLGVPATAATRIRNRSYLFSLVPLTGGASGAVLVFRQADLTSESHASFATFVRETVFMPLRSLRETLSVSRLDHPLFADAAAALDQVLSSLEMAPEVEEAAPEHRYPKVIDIVENVAHRFGPFADLKGITLQVDVPDLEERFRNSDQLAEALGVLMDNSMHYVPAGGQVVLGVRWMEHKGKPLLLFFVMDNGPVVPEGMRLSIFEPGFVWNPSAPERAGRGLFRCREFAVAHAGSIWVESKTGKACTFFLRVRPDGAR
jgi:signal transduction histidine kinase